MKDRTYERKVKKLLRGMLDPIAFFSGLCIISAKGANGTALLNLFLRWGYKHRGIQRATHPISGEELTLISCTYPTYLSLLGRLEGKGYANDIRLEQCAGLPFLIKKYKSRIGIPLGLAVMTAIVVLSLSVVWDIRISGSSTVSDREITEALRVAGIEVGSRISSLDIDEIENRFLIDSSSISWIAINLRGTVAHVEVIEKILPPEREEKKPSNLVAEFNGEITSLEIYSGKPMVKIGDIVSEGDLLVSGIYDSKTSGFRIRPSVGRVFAKTQHTIEVTVPLEYTEKQYSGKEICENSLNFFGKTIKFSKNSRNLPQEYDTIIEGEYFSFFGGPLLPVSLTRTRCIEYTEVQKARTPQEALDEAYRQLDEELYSYTRSSPLLSKRISTVLEDGVITLICRITIIEDIAKSIGIDYVYN